MDEFEFAGCAVEAKDRDGLGRGDIETPAKGVGAAAPDVPVALLTSTNVADEPFVFEETAVGKALWKRQHEALFASYARGVHEYYATGHNIHREDPHAVANAVRHVIGMAR